MDDKIKLALYTIMDYCNNQHLCRLCELYEKSNCLLNSKRPYLWESDIIKKSNNDGDESSE